MSRAGRERLASLSHEAIPLVLGGIAGAIWLLIFSADVLYADDCLQYVKKVQNFVNIPKGLLEDCMRTGSVQAIITGALGGIGGGAIAVAINNGLKGAGGPGPHVVPDDKGKQEGEKEPGRGDLPEEPPGQDTRENTPESCQNLFDRYRSALQEAHALTAGIQAAKKEYERVFNNHQMNLAKVTIQLGMDAADMASAGVGGVKGGMGVARAVAHAPEVLADLISKAAARSGNLAKAISGLIEDIAELMSKGRTFAKHADDAAKLSAKAEAKIADLVKEAASLEGKVARYDELVRFARSADATLLERNAVSKSILGAEEALKDVNMNHQRILDRKQALENWATVERMDIANEDARKFAARHEQLGAERAKIEAMRAKNAEAAKAAHAEWQGKMNELSAARKELEKAQETARHLQKQKTNKLMAEQEVRKTAGVRDEAKTRLDHAEGELRAFDEAEKAKAKVRDIEGKIKDVESKLETAKVKADEARTRLKDADALDEQAAAIEKAKATLDEKTAALARADADLKAFEASPELADYRAKRNAIQAKRDAASEKFQTAKYNHDNAEGAALKVRNDELRDALAAHGLDPDDMGSMEMLPPAKLDELRARQKAMDQAARNAKAELNKASAELEAARTEAQSAMADLDAQNAAVVQQREALDTELRRARMDLSDAQGGMHDVGVTEAGAQGRAKSLRDDARKVRGEAESDLSPDNPESHAALEGERAKLGEELASGQYDAAKQHKGDSRAEFENKVESARKQSDHANKAHADAEANLAKANEALEEADLTGTGESSGHLQQLNWAQENYNRISKEQEALRIKYEELSSGSAGNPAEAAAIRKRIEELESELSAWKDPDWEVEASKRNPSKYAEWKSEQGSFEAIKASEANIAGLQTKISELQTNLATIERKLSEQQQQAGNQSTESLESERAGVASDLKTRQAELDTAKSELRQQQDAAATAQSEEQKTKTAIAEKEAKKRELEEQKRREDEELAKLKYNQEHPVYAIDDVTGVAPMLGSEWTPYHGSDAEAIANKSRAARQRFDKFMDGITPDFLTAPFRWAGGKAGELFHKAFGGQSPEEVAAIIKRGDQRVKELAAALAEAEADYDAKLDRAHKLQGEYNDCLARNPVR